MFVWSKRLVATLTLLGLFVPMLGVFLLDATPDSMSSLKIPTTGWMNDHAPYAQLIPLSWHLPMVMLFVLLLQRHLQSS
jgi:hypothetical protein